MGWNTTKATKECEVLRDTPDGTHFYVPPTMSALLILISSHSNVNTGNDSTPMVQRRNLFATQFHPEKSQQDGLNLLKRFNELSLSPKS